MNYALCSPLLSHMPPMKSCPMTTMHPLPPYAYFIHDHQDIPSATTILWPHLFEPPRIWQIRCLEQLWRLVTSGTSTPMIPDVILITCIIISNSGHPSVTTKDQLRISHNNIHPDICQIRHSGHPSHLMSGLLNQQLKNPVQILYQTRIPVLPLIKSAQFSGWFLLAKILSKE